MSNQTLIAEAEDALIALLKAQLGGATGVAAVTSQDFDEAGDIIAVPPAIRVLFRRETLESGRDATALTYVSLENFAALCGAENLRSIAEERKGAYELVSQVCDILAGARLTLPSKTAGQRPTCILRGVELVQFGAQGTWYAVSFDVESISQMSGVAA